MSGDLQQPARRLLPPLDPLELHSGLIGGERKTPLPLPPEPELTGTPREVLEALLVEPLSDPPCHVAFSGGRDSSAMLAVATLVARRHGLPDPIPLSARLEEYPRTWETDWQEMTVRHLGLKEWHHIPIVDELDALGEVATGGLRRHGLFWPSQGHSMLVFASHAGSGSLLTGGGGDEVFSRWGQRRFALRSLMAMRPRRRAAKWMAFSALPLRVQTGMIQMRFPVSTPWLRPEVERELVRLRRLQAFERSSSWGDALERLIRSRYLELIRATLDTFAGDHGVRLHEPFYDARFVRAMGRTSPRNGYQSRTQAMERHFADVLPAEVLRRGTKAVFTDVAWGPGARAFADSWDGRGLDETLVDPERVREEWAKSRPNARSLSCLHQAWLAAQDLA
jgi:asparagine synthetase B (glutamine-hydrolysing)